LVHGVDATLVLVGPIERVAVGAYTPRVAATITAAMAETADALARLGRQLLRYQGEALLGIEKANVAPGPSFDAAHSRPP